MASYANRIRLLQSTISTYQGKINRVSSALESLERFQGEIVAAQADFHDCMQRKKSILSQAHSYEVNTKCIERYRDGMDTRFNGIGYTSISAAYTAWLIAINAKLAAYRVEISVTQGLIGSCNESIHNLEAQQRAEEAAAEAAAQNAQSENE